MPLRRHELPLTADVIAEPIGTRFERRERVDIGLLLRCVPNVVPISPTLGEWNRRHAYSVAADGQLCRNNPVWRRDPNPLGNVLAEPNPMHEAEKGHPSPECFK
jgi:hypothetical protein